MTFKAENLTPELAQLMRGDRQGVTVCRLSPNMLTPSSSAMSLGCDATSTIVSAIHRIFVTSSRFGGTHTLATDSSQYSHNNASKIGVASNNKDNWLIGLGYRPLQADCPLFARKFSSSTTMDTLNMALSCAGLQLGHWCYLDTDV